MRMHDEPGKTIEENLESLFDHKYKNIVRAENGNGQQSSGYIGESGKRKFFIKVGTNSQNAKDPMVNDIEVQSDIPIDNAVRDGISPLVDYKKFNGSYVTVEPLFEGGKTLGNWGLVDNKKDFEDLVSGILKADMALVKYGYFHRDLHPGNIMLRKNECGNLEVRLTDLKNAKKTREVETQTISTGMCRFGRDPSLDECFSGEPGKYTESCEIYQIGMAAITAVNGISPVRYDFVNKTAINVFTGESVLDKNGKIDRDKHQNAINEGIKRMPKKIRKAHGDWLRNCLTLYPAYKTQNLETLALNFEAAKHPGFIETMKRNLGTVIVTGVTTLAAVGLSLVPISQHFSEQQKQEIVQASKYKVTAEWESWGPELINNLAELKVSAMSGSGIYPYNVKVLSANAGDELSLTVSAKEKPRPRNLSNNGTLWLLGRAYIEGQEVDGKIFEEFGVYVQQPNAVYYERGSAAVYKNIKLPQNLIDGAYVLAVELFAPEKDLISRNPAFEDISFADPGKALSRKRVPIIVGNPETATDIAVFNLGGDSTVSYSDLRQPFDNGYTNPRGEFTFESIISEEGELEKTKLSYHGIFMPGGSSTQTRIIHMTVRDSKDELIGYTAMPIKRKIIENKFNPSNPIYDTEYALPDKDFARKLVEYRRSLDDQRDITNK